MDNKDLISKNTQHHPIIVMRKGQRMSEGSTCACGGNCGCGNHTEEAPRAFLTRDEYVQRLEHYLEDLKAEIEAVERELVDLRQTA